MTLRNSSEVPSRVGWATIGALCCGTREGRERSVAWIQSALNVLASTGYIALAAPLVVDGIYGPKTKAAVDAVQQKLGMAITGFVGDAEYNALAGLLSKI